MRAVAASCVRSVSTRRVTSSCSSEVVESTTNTAVLQGLLQLLQVFFWNSFTDEIPDEAAEGGAKCARRGQQQKERTSDQQCTGSRGDSGGNRNCSTYCGCGPERGGEIVLTSGFERLFGLGGIILPVTGRLRLGCNNRDSIWVDPVWSKNSCGLAVVILQEAAQSLLAAHAALKAADNFLNGVFTSLR